MHQILNWARQLIRQATNAGWLDDPNDDVLREAYCGSILRDGLDSELTRKNAEDLGLDVDALVERHKEMLSAGRKIALNIGATMVSSRDSLTPLMPRPSVELELGRLPVQMVVSDLGITGEISFPSSRVTIDNILQAGVKFLEDYLAEHAKEYEFRLRGGVRDLEFVELSWSGFDECWTLSGQRKPELLQRTPGRLHTERSIERHRLPAMQGHQGKAQPWPVLDHVWLQVDRTAGGHLDVFWAFETEEECTRGDRADQLAIKFPCEHRVRWGPFWLTTPASNFVRENILTQAGSLGETLRQFGVASVIADYSTPDSAVDYRGFLRSGGDGPAPLPKKRAWPICPQCGSPAKFAESLDFRALAFAPLLPGSSASIFVCNSCIEAGDMTRNVQVIWLPRDEEVELISNGPPDAIMEARQWLSADFPPYWDLPEDLAKDVEDWTGHILWRDAAGPTLASKAGGFPRYLDDEEIFFDTHGCRMEYIGQFMSHEALSFDGCGYVLHSTGTGETVAVLQTW